MKKVTAGVAIIASVFLLAGCGQSTTSSMNGSNSADDVASVQDTVNQLFSNKKHTKLAEDTNSDSVAEARQDINDLKSSKIQDKLYKLADKADELVTKKIDSESYSSDDTSESTSESSKSQSATSNATKYEQQIMKLGIPTHATDVTYSNHTVTWTGFDAWKNYSRDELDGLVAFLETITLRQATVYNQGTPKMVVKLSDGTQICHKDSGHDIVWDINE